MTNGLFNAALYKPAIQSSTYSASDTGTLSAHLAVDGNNDTNIFKGHCQSTLYEIMPWWMVDLRGQFVVDTIKITNRMDLNAYYRLRNFTIDIFDQDPRQLTNFPNILGYVCYKQAASLNQPELVISCPTPKTGRFVRLLLNLTTVDVLHICEMEVLVSQFLYGDNLFYIQMNTKLSGLVLDTLTVSDPYKCIEECFARWLSRCTAFNWVTTSKTCQLFSVNPNIDLRSNLTSAPGTHFYLQDNSFT
ncbi:hypothetical protein Btru_041514 [Bulinus truncatus]|nr:hypothetical protein Btru_041514 [Bulinus truncatus]